MRGLGIAHLAHQDDVRVLAQHRAQHGGKRKIDLLVHLNLVQSGDTVLNRILDGDDLARGRIELVQRRVQRRRLATARWPGDEHHAAHSVDDRAEALRHARRHAEFVEAKKPAFAIEQAHDDRLTVRGRHGRHAHVHVVIAH